MFMRRGGDHDSARSDTEQRGELLCAVAYHEGGRVMGRGATQRVLLLHLAYTYVFRTARGGIIDL